MADEKKQEKTPAKKFDVKKWIARKLMAINEMKDEAKAKKVAERVMKNKRG